jgi:hypothetical protein
MSEVTGKSFLTRGTKAKIEGDVYHGHHLHQIPLLDRFEDRLSMLHNAGTVRVQFGNRYAETACKERSELYGDFGTK